MGCAGSKTQLTAFANGGPALIDGLFSAGEGVTVTPASGLISVKSMVTDTPLKLKVKGDGGSIPSAVFLQKSCTGPFAVPAEPYKNLTNHSFLLLDAESRLVALVKKDATRVVSKEIKVGVNIAPTIGGTFNDAYTATIYSAKPRFTEQPTAMEANGTPLFIWAQIRLTEHDGMPAGSTYPNQLAGRKFAVYHSSPDGFEDKPKFYLKYNRSAESWLLLNAAEATEVVGKIPNLCSVVAGPGVDPMLLTLLLVEWSAFGIEYGGTGTSSGV